jgi:hypothetical protein
MMKPFDQTPQQALDKHEGLLHNLELIDDARFWQHEYELVTAALGVAVRTLPEAEATQVLRDVHRHARTLLDVVANRYVAMALLDKATK